jgi:hypothetical protein
LNYITKLSIPLNKKWYNIDNNMKEVKDECQHLTNW